ncbi:MAG: hypothetical protein JRF33_18330, partial [Deltaproteobacteria bacterium]|nr:hypothetical protein [Deltaproteobacteria bacterium]
MSPKRKSRPLDESHRPTWRRALSAWGLGVDLGLPEELLDSDDLAFIDLRDRRTRVNLGLLNNMGLGQHLEAIFAHEAGHHCRHPQTLIRSAKLIARQRWLLRVLETEQPGNARIGKRFAEKRYDFLLNLLLDIRINHSLADRYGDSFQAIYTRILHDAPDPLTAVFSFTMACYDALWSIPKERRLANKRAAKTLTRVSSTWQSEAEQLAEDFSRAGDNGFLWLDLYLEAVWPYLVEDSTQGPILHQGLTEGSLVANLDDLSPEELEQVMRRLRDEDQADDEREARKHPVLVELPPDEDFDPEAESPQNPSLGELINKAGSLGQNQRTINKLLRWFYQREAERYEVRLEQEARNEPMVPTTLKTWEPESDTAAIDWTASLGRMPVAIPGLTLLEREYENEVVGQSTKTPPWIEIYIDSSGSMPNPSTQFSALAFAGLLLARAALRAGSMARIIQYSSENMVFAMEEFSADQNAIDDALLEYLGGGTLFPFELLSESCERFRSHTRIERVVISDQDFFYNLGKTHLSASAAEVLREACIPPHRLTAILNLGPLGDNPSLQPFGLLDTGIRLLSIKDWNELHGVA